MAIGGSANGGRRAAHGALVAAALLLLIGCGTEPAVPADTLLWRVDEWKASSPGVRVATATILSFRSSGEYVELHARVLEQADATVYVASDAPRIVMIGTWTKEDETIHATRTRVKRPVPFSGPRDPFCDERLSFTISGRSVVGNAGSAEPGTYSPVTRLVAPEFEIYATEARTSGFPCVAPADD